MARLRRLIAFVRALPEWRRDVLLGAAIALEAFGDIALGGPSDVVERIGALALIAAVGVAVGTSRRWPLASIALGFGALAVGQGIPEVYDSSIFIGVLALPYRTGRHCRESHLAAALALMAIGLGAILANDPEGVNVLDVVFVTVVFVAAPLLIGRLLRNRAALTAALTERTRRSERERATLAEQAALDERTRIAGELHDLVSHALGAMTVQGAAARRLASSDPDRAAASFAAVEATGREALTELRAPQPSLAHLDDLIERTRRAGSAAELVVEGEPASLSAGADLTAYRVVQAALTAAVRDHGASRARVLVRYGADAVEIEVSDDGRSGGRDLLGMRERLGVYGGELQTEERLSGGQTVRARLPLEAVPA
jgi:signal transduction histidine kinase